MENPVKTVTSGFSLSAALKWLGAAIVVFAVLDALNLSDYLFYPYTSIKSKFTK